MVGAKMVIVAKMVGAKVFAGARVKSTQPCTGSKGVVIFLLTTGIVAEHFSTCEVVERQCVLKWKGHKT